MVQSRAAYNRLIMETLDEYLKANPRLRFHQALQNLNINEREQGDRFFEESSETYKLIKIGDTTEHLS